MVMMVLLAVCDVTDVEELKQMDSHRTDTSTMRKKPKRQQVACEI